VVAQRLAAEMYAFADEVHTGRRTRQWRSRLWRRTATVAVRRRPGAQQAQHGIGHDR
jgi:hypothetical protein